MALMQEVLPFRRRQSCRMRTHDLSGRRVERHLRTSLAATEPALMLRLLDKMLMVKMLSSRSKHHLLTVWTLSRACQPGRVMLQLMVSLGWKGGLTGRRI